MKKRKFIVFFTILFILMTVVGFTLLTGSEADNQISINGIPQRMDVMQGVTGNSDSPLVKMKTEDDLQKIYDSMDPITGQPTYIPPVMVKISDEDEFQQVESCVLTCVIYEGESYDFTFKYVVKDGKKVLVTRGEIFEAFKKPNSDDYVLDCWGLIYLLNLDEKRLEVYNSKEAGGYSFDTYNETNYRKVWAGKPSFNPSGTKMIYYTERATNEVGSIWVMDNETKTEKPIPNTTAYTNVLQWVDEDIAYIYTPYQILRIDTSNYTSQSVYSDNGNPIGQAVISYPYMFMTDRKRPRIYNLEDGSIREYDASEYTYCSAAASGTEYMALLVFSMPKESNAFYQEAVVLDLATGKDCVISVNEKDVIALFLPYNDVKAKLDVQIDGNTYNQVSYFIEYSSLVFD
jgi:hypothetical protein